MRELMILYYLCHLYAASPGLRDWNGTTLMASSVKDSLMVEVCHNFSRAKRSAAQIDQFHFATGLRILKDNMVDSLRNFLQSQNTNQFINAPMKIVNTPMKLVKTTMKLSPNLLKMCSLIHYP